jgi:ribosomal protein S18 acetylase RimI-like enzyme
VERPNVISYRTFRNDDPPRLLELWNGCFTGRGAAELRGTMLLEYLVFAKPYFDPAGLLIAEADGAPVGFVHAGFGPDPSQHKIDTSTGVLSVLGVLPEHRGQGIGSELLRRAEAYLTGRGARALVAGPLGWLNPFTFALYGGSQAPGFLDSDLLAGPFLTKRGCTASPGARVHHLRLEQFLGVADGRFAALRPRYEIHGGPWRGCTWWQECVVGPVEVQELKLQDKAGAVAGRALAWVMDTFNQRWGEQSVGLLGVEVEPALRRRGLGRFLLSQILRYFHDQYFTLAEVQVAAGDAAAEGLVRGLGFEAVDEGRQYRKPLA